MIEKLGDNIPNPIQMYRDDQVADLGIIVRNNRDKINELVDKVNKMTEWFETPTMYYTDGTPVPKPSPEDKTND